MADRGLEGSEREKGGRIRALVVDDEKELARGFAEYLGARGFDPVVAHDVDEARRVLETDLGLDLCITDVYLGSRPGGEAEAGAEGHALAELCRRRKPRLPVILLTGRPSLDAAVEGIRSHADDFLTKPVSLPLLHRTALRAVEERRLAHRLEELEQVNELIARLLPNVIEAKDPTTRGHSERVVRYAETLGRRCGIEGDELRELKLAALLHDIGKIGVPEAILTKPGRLSPEERAQIEEHPAIGRKILEPIAHLARVCDWVYQHHERWDGVGYPEGIAGEEVTLPGRILILSEVYDALATQRSYKEAWSLDKITAFLDAQAGGHFDPELAALVAAGLRREGADFFRVARPDRAKQPELF